MAFLKVNLFLKRVIDIVCSFVLLLVLSPFLVVVAVMIKTDSVGPVLFVQERRTKGGEIFKMYKFRSMIVGAEKKGTGIFNFQDDERVTKIGRWMREHSVDELPQLLNVLQGSISLVGPRPCVVYELGEFETLNKRYRKRFEMKGGITGYAQVHGRNTNSWDEKVTLDNEYIELFKKRGIILDIELLFQTLLTSSKQSCIYEVKQDEKMEDEEAARLANEEIIRLAHAPDGDM